MSWLFSQVLVEEYLGDISLDGEQSVQSSGSNTQQAYCASDKMTGFSRLSRFGMTFKPLTENLGEALLKSYLGAFHVRTFQPQEKVLESQEKDQGCGDKWHGLLAKYDPNTHLWKTVQCSLLEDLEQSLEIWPKWGLMLNGVSWEQTPLVLPTSETVFGFSLPTPVASDATSGAVIGKNDLFYTTSTGMPRKVNQNGKDGSVGLGRLVQMWPTPDANCGQRGTQPNWTTKRKSGQPAQYTINQAVRDRQTWPTPVTRDYKDSGSQEALIRARDKRDSPGLGLLVGAEGGGNLNPMWVEQLMGWPLGWTDLKPLEMDKCLYARQQHGEY